MHNESFFCSEIGIVIVDAKSEILKTNAFLMTFDIHEQIFFKVCGSDEIGPILTMKIVTNIAQRHDSRELK